MNAHSKCIILLGLGILYACCFPFLFSGEGIIRLSIFPHAYQRRDYYYLFSNPDLTTPNAFNTGTSPSLPHCFSHKGQYLPDSLSPLAQRHQNHWLSWQHSPTVASTHCQGKTCTPAATAITQDEFMLLYFSHTSTHHDSSDHKNHLCISMYLLILSSFFFFKQKTKAV